MEQDSYHTQTETAQYKDVDLSALTPDEFKAKIREWRQDPVLYFIERLGINCSLGDTYEPGDEMDIHEKRLLRVLPEAIVLRKPIVQPSDKLLISCGMSLKPLLRSAHHKIL